MLRLSRAAMALVASLFFTFSTVLVAQSVAESNWANAGYAPNFQALCADPLPPQRQAEAEAALARAEQALAKGDLDTVQRALSDALSAAYRGTVGPEEMSYSISFKCTGEANAQRLFDTQLSYYLQREKQGDRNIPYWVTAAGEGAQGLADRVVKMRSGRASAVGQIDEISANADRTLQFGAYLLPAEKKIRAACDEAVQLVNAAARRLHDEELAKEDVAFNRAPTEQERALTSNMAGVANMVGAMADPEVVLQEQRVDESMEHLIEARDWYFYDEALGSTNNQSPESARARERGNTLLTKADDASRDVLARDEYYEMAIAYFEFGDWSDELRKTTAARQGIAAEVARSRQQAEAQQEEIARELQDKAEDMQRAVQDMQKTEAEKKSFNEEADALEAELGF